MLSALSSMLDPSTAAAAARTLDLHGAAATHRASSAHRTLRTPTGAVGAPAPSSPRASRARRR